MDIAKLTARDLDEFYARLAARGLSTTTRHHYHALIRASLNQAIRWGWLVPPNPAGAAEAPPLRPEGREPPTPAEARRLAIAVIEAHPDLATLIFVAAATGMRRGELCGLRWCDVDLEMGQVTVNQKVSDLPGGMVILPGTKTKKRRRLALDPVTVAVLVEQHAVLLGVVRR
jgi:integrase